MTDPDEQHQKVSLLIERQRFDEARHLLAEIFSRQPNDPAGRLLAARLGIHSEDYAYAEEHLNAFLGGDPDNWEARTLRYRLLCGTDRYVEAEQVITGLLRDFPDHAHFYGLYAWLMLRTLHIDKAKALSREGLRLDPTEYLSRLVGLLVDVIEDRSGEAEQRLQEIVREDPQALHVAWNVATVLQSQYRFAEALQVVRGILRVTPGDPAVVDTAIALRVMTHWSMMPLAPLERYGWIGSGVLWGVVVLSAYLASRFAPVLLLPMIVIYVAFAVYSWVWPPLLKRWLRARGF